MKTNHHMEGVNTLTLPLPVVKQLNFSNGICRDNVIDYKYKDLYVEMTGAGVLGFGSVTKTMLNTGESSTDTVLEWNVDRWIPEKTRSVNEIGGKISTVETEYSIQDVGNTYFSYERFSTVTDMYNETVKTSNIYDIAKGVLSSQTVSNNGNKMYKRVDYSGYKEVSGVWLPGVITLSQRHEHDSNVYSTATKYTYDDNGNIVSTTVHSGTDLALTTNATYDVYGNCLSSYSTGKSVTQITKYNAYDPTGRFVIKSWQVPSAAVMTFTYDLWGNVLTENDCTDSGNILTTTHTYDGWGRRTATILPDDRMVSYSVGWGKTSEKHHYSLVEETGRPWVLTWYDEAGNETVNTTFGPKNVLIQKTTDYDSYGKIRQITEQTGKLKTWKTFRYDELGRLLTEKSSLGSEVSYTYGNRTVTTKTNDREYTKITDVWGNPLSSSDPSGATVTYKYGSNGQPSSITTDGTVVNITYDCAGNRISVSDPDAGKSTYEYAADGTLLKHTDAKGVATINQYDALGRLSSIKIGDQTISNFYGTSGNAKLRLVKKQLGNNCISYTYDNFGRVKREIRNIQGSGSYNTSYTYDSDNRLSTVTYDGITPVTYTYDDYGFKKAVSFEGKDIYRLESYDGLTMKTSFADSIVFTRTVDSKGLEKTRQLSCGIRNLEYLVVDFDTLTLNLRSRGRKGYLGETFRYDDLDRLIGVNKGQEEIMKISYARNGNILSKSGLGTYSYNSAIRPHAVVSVENTESVIPSSELLTTFSSFGLIDRIEDNENKRLMSFSYGADMQRCTSAYSEDGKLIRSIVYANNMEIIRENIPFRIYYLDDNVIYVTAGRAPGLHYLFKDHLGTILSAFNVKGSKTFEASYDAWGKQEVKSNQIGLRRGYTGHEMINEFGIINMNGRLYDPELGRFFSPDPYVQFPDFSQSYNRYSYCLNNPLKYTDPSGQLAGTAFLVASSLFHIGSAMLHAHATGGNVIKAGLVSLLSSPLTSFGIGKLYGGTGSIGKELLRAGTHGLASGLASAMDGGTFGSFASGFISGGASAMFMYGAMKGLAPDDLTDSQRMSLGALAASIGGAASIIAGGSYLRGALIGYQIAMFNYLEGEDPVVFFDEEGNKVVELQDVIVISKVSKKFLTFKKDFILWTYSISNENLFMDSYGNSLTRFEANSTVGSNNKPYWKTSVQRPIINQYK